MDGHKKHAEKVRGMLVKNKAIAVLAVLFAVTLLVNIVRNRPVSEQTETVQITNENWRFYPIDLAVLGAGGAVCAAMILREKRRAKEELK